MNTGCVQRRGEGNRSRNAAVAVGSQRGAERAGFTLVEVLMAVLILGIGLLGLGAVLPAVVKQQQTSTDSILGTIAMNAAQASLRVGRQGRNEVQRVRLAFTLDAGTRAIPAGARFTLSFKSETTADILVLSLAATPQAVEEALSSLAGLVGDLSPAMTTGQPERTFKVAGSSSLDSTSLLAVIVYDIEFVGRMGGARVPLLEARGAAGVTATVSQTVAGEPALSGAYWTALAKIDPATSGGLTHGSGVPAQPLPNDASWIVPQVELRTGTTRERGATLLGADGSNSTYFPADRSLSIPLAERLQPADSAGVAAPQYVWDIAARRMGPRRTGNDAYGVPYGPGHQPADYTRVQTVVFLRRLDGRLTAPANASVFQALLARAGAPVDLRWPVSMNNATGVPSGDGLVAGRTYAPPVAWTVDYAPTRVGPDGLASRDMIEIGGGGGVFDQPPAGVSSFGRDTVFQMIARPGQVLVDNLGNVYTVIGPVLGQGYGYTLRVVPPVPPEMLATDTDAERGSGTLRQILFVPEGAVSARVEVVNP